MNTVENQSFELDHIALTNDESKYKIVFILKAFINFLLLLQYLYWKFNFKAMN